MNNDKVVSILYSAKKPTDAQIEKIRKFLLEKYENDALEWKEDLTVTEGFRLEVGKEIYDWTNADWRSLKK